MVHQLIHCHCFPKLLFYDHIQNYLDSSGENLLQCYVFEGTDEYKSTVGDIIDDLKLHSALNPEGKLDPSRGNLAHIRGLSSGLNQDPEAGAPRPRVGTEHSEGEFAAWSKVNQRLQNTCGKNQFWDCPAGHARHKLGIGRCFPERTWEDVCVESVNRASVVTSQWSTQEDPPRRNEHRRVNIELLDQDWEDSPPNRNVFVLVTENSQAEQPFQRVTKIAPLHMLLDGIENHGTLEELGTHQDVLHETLLSICGVPCCEELPSELGWSVFCHFDKQNSSEAPEVPCCSVPFVTLEAGGSRFRFTRESSLSYNKKSMDSIAQKRGAMHEILDHTTKAWQNLCAPFNCHKESQIQAYCQHIGSKGMLLLVDDKGRPMCAAAKCESAINKQMFFSSGRALPVRLMQKAAGYTDAELAIVVAMSVSVNDPFKFGAICFEMAKIRQTTQTVSEIPLLQGKFRPLVQDEFHNRACQLFHAPSGNLTARYQTSMPIVKEEFLLSTRDAILQLRGLKKPRNSSELATTHRAVMDILTAISGLKTLSGSDLLALLIVANILPNLAPLLATTELPEANPVHPVLDRINENSSVQVSGEDLLKALSVDMGAPINVVENFLCEVYRSSAKSFKLLDITWPGQMFTFKDKDNDLSECGFGGLQRKLVAMDLPQEPEDTHLQEDETRRDGKRFPRWDQTFPMSEKGSSAKANTKAIIIDFKDPLPEQLKCLFLQPLSEDTLEGMTKRNDQILEVVNQLYGDIPNVVSCHLANGKLPPNFRKKRQPNALCHQRREQAQPKPKRKRDCSMTTTEVPRAKAVNRGGGTTPAQEAQVGGGTTPAQEAQVGGAPPTFFLGTSPQTIMVLTSPVRQLKAIPAGFEWKEFAREAKTAVSVILQSRPILRMLLGRDERNFRAGLCSADQQGRTTHHWTIYKENDRLLDVGVKAENSYSDYINRKSPNVENKIDKDGKERWVLPNKKESERHFCTTAVLMVIPVIPVHVKRWKFLNRHHKKFLRENSNLTKGRNVVALTDERERLLCHSACWDGCGYLLFADEKIIIQLGILSHLRQLYQVSQPR